MSGERCRCGAGADFRCESNRVAPALKAQRRGGQTVIIQPFEEFHLCADCIRRVISEDDAPRKVEALPHHAARLRQEAAEIAAKIVGSVEQPRFDEGWGKR